MPNTNSAKKAVRSSGRKRTHNLFWRGRIKRIEKTLKESLSDKSVDVEVVKSQLSSLQKVLDKASKNNVISKNKANRLKSKYARNASQNTGETPTREKQKKSSKK